MSTTNQATPQSLWPQPIPIIGCTGEYSSGKTLFGVTIDPGRTRIYDTEKSAGSYQALGFDRIDVPAEMLHKHPAGYKPIDTFIWWREHIRTVEPGKFRVIVLDTAVEIESGITDWVRANPGYFSRTAAQYLKMSGLMWGDVKELWKAVLSDLASRCETFVFTVHMGDVWSGDKPTGQRKPKGKSTLMELASLYLEMERKADAKGNVPVRPAAVVKKSRLAHTRFDQATGLVEIVPALPPRLPVATPAAIREYLLTPPDYTKLKDEEKIQKQVISEDERAQVRLATAEAEAETERLRVERLAMEEQRRQQEARRRAAPPTKPAPAATAAPVTENQSPAPTAPPGNGASPVEESSAASRFLARLQELDAMLSSAGLCSASELLGFVTQSMAENGGGSDPTKWTARQCATAEEYAKVFESKVRATSLPEQKSPTVSVTQIDRIDSLMKQLGITGERAMKGLRKYKVSRWEELTPEQATEIENRLTEQLKMRQQ